MFDISFAELMMIGVVALLVIGPDKLPQVARTVGAFVGRLQRYVSQVKEEVNREIRFEELQNLQQEIKQGVDGVESSILDGAHEMQEAVVPASEEVKPKRKARKAAPKDSSKAGSVAKGATKKTSVKKTTIKKSAVKKVTPRQSKGSA